MVEKSKDGIELFRFGSITVDDVLNDSNGIGHVEEDEDYYYVYPDYKPGYCGDTIWMVNKRNHQVSFTNVSSLIIYYVVDKLTDVPLDVFKKESLC